MRVRRRFTLSLSLLAAFSIAVVAQQRGGGTQTQGGQGGTTQTAQPGVPSNGTSTTQTQQANGTISGSISQVGLGIPIKKATVTITRLADEAVPGTAAGGNAGGGTGGTTGGATVVSADNFGQGNRGNGGNGGNGGGGSRTAQTDNGGMYTITGVAAGRYRVRASATGFVTQEFGQQTLDTSGTPVNISLGGTLTVDIFLIPGGFIEGTVMDEDGAPIVGGQVQLYVADYATGQRMLVPNKTAQTNDIGQYRLPGLDPGEYYLAAAPASAQSLLPPDTAVPQSVSGDRGRGGPQGTTGTNGDPRGGGRGGRGGQRGGTTNTQAQADAPPARAYPPTFFPGIADATQAVAVQLAPGFEAHGINVTLRPVSLVTVKGSVVIPVVAPRQQQQQPNQQPQANGNQSRNPSPQGNQNGTQGTQGTQGNQGGGNTGGGGRGNNLAAAQRGGGGGGGRGGGGGGTQGGFDPTQGGGRGGRGGQPTDAQGGPGGRGVPPGGFPDQQNNATIILMPVGIRAGGGAGGGGNNGGGGDRGGRGAGGGGGRGGRGNDFAAAQRGGGGRGGPGGGGPGGGGFGGGGFDPQNLPADIQDMINQQGGRGGGTGTAVGGTQQVRVSTNQDGTFQIDNVIPGSYVVYASARSNNVQVSSYGRLDITFGNVENYTLVLRPGVEVPGKIYLDGEAPQGFNAGNIQVRFEPMDNLPVGTVTGRASTEGTFAIQDIPPGRYRLSFGSLPNGSYVSKALIGGSDALGEVFQLDGDGTPLQMLIGFTQGKIEAMVEQSGKPLPNARVLLTPANRNRIDLFKTGSSDKDGKATFSNVPPGTYKLFAWESMPKANAYLNPQFLEQFEDHGRIIMVEKSGTATESHLQALAAIQ